jgi:hypothetical protein
MGWVHWTFIAVLALGPVVTAGSVGKARKTVTPADAAWSVVLNFGLILAVIFWG